MTVKKIFLWMVATCCCLFSQEVERITNAEQITYEWLIDAGAKQGYTDHIPHFKKIFDLLKVRTFLEFGLGFSTKYFLDHSSKVISVEFITNGYGPSWMNECLELYKNINNWIPVSFFSGYLGDASWAPYKYLGSENVYKACSYQSAHHKSYAPINDFYLKELDAFISGLFKAHKITVSFVDPGLYLRGDLVQLLFDKSPVILAHDTNIRYTGVNDDVYGYSRVKTPENYEEIYIRYGMGTTAWIIKNNQTQELIDEMKKYALSVYE